MVWIKEIWRSKLKFGLLSSAVGLLFFLLLFVNTLSSTLLDQFVGAIENNSADLMVFAADAQATIPASRLSPEDVSRVEQIAGVSSAAPLSVMATEASLRGEQIDVSLWGVDPGGPGAPSDLEEGRTPREGETLVDTSGRDAGMTIGTTVDIADVELEVVGVARDATYSVSPTLYVANDTWSEIFLSDYPDAPGAPVNLVGVALDDDADPDVVAGAVSSLDGLQGLTPAQAASATPGVSSIEQSFGLIAAITFVVVIVVVGFFFQIFTVQKLRVFALLEALGSRIQSLAGYVLGQIGLLVALGVAIGVALLAVTALATRETFAISIDLILPAVLGGAILLASLASGVTSIRRIAKQDAARVATGGMQ